MLKVNGIDNDGGDRRNELFIVLLPCFSSYFGLVQYFWWLFSATSTRACYKYWPTCSVL